MEETLLNGDYIFVDKTRYGALLPRSPYEIPWFNVIYHYYLETFNKSLLNEWPSYRFVGWDKIKSCDIVVFRHLEKKETYYIKRVIGLPGDTLEIIEGKIIINGSIPSSLETKNIAEQLVTPEYFIRNNDSPINLFPGKNEFNWAIDNFGPLVMPARGYPIELNDDNVLRYKQTIEQFEKVRIEKVGDQFFLDSVPEQYYTFKNNYYFMLGDNRYHSNDSRYWGFVPKENIIGKAVMILWSQKKNGSEPEWRWDRFCKAVK
jgi:signal peptidase I